MRKNPKASCNTSATLSKYLMCGAVSALALAPLCARADDAMSTTTTTTTTSTTSTAMPMASSSSMPMMADPVAVSGTITHYYADRTGYVTAMQVQTATGLEMIHFPANRAAAIYGMYPTGGNIDVWVVPADKMMMGDHEMMGGHKKMMGDGDKMMDGKMMDGKMMGDHDMMMEGHDWNAVGAGKDRPDVWWNVVGRNDISWLDSEPYFDGGAKETKGSGNLKGYVTNRNGDILALMVENSKGTTIVRVPPQVRQVAPGYKGDDRVTPLYKNSRVEFVGTPEAVRRGGLSGYNPTVAATVLRINEDEVGAIGLPAMTMGRRSDTIFGFNLFGSMNSNMKDKTSGRVGYTEYMPNGSESMMMPATDMSTTTSSTTTTTSMATDMATGRVMLVGADGSMMPVVKKGKKMYVQMADGTMTELKKSDGKYMVPESMTGARMMMVMADGSKMDMDTVNGKLMVKMADGSMAPVTLHTP